MFQAIVRKAVKTIPDGKVDQAVTRAIEKAVAETHTMSEKRILDAVHAILEEWDGSYCNVELMFQEILNSLSSFKSK